MKKKNNILTIVILIAIAILLVTVIVSVFNFSPSMKEYTYGEMVDAFEKNEVYGYIKDPNEFSVILFLSVEDWNNYWDDDTKNDKVLYENLRVANLASSDYYEFFGSPYSSYEPSMLSSIQERLEGAGIKSNLENRYESKEVKETPWYVSNLPLIIMVVLFIVFMVISFRQANGGKMSSFGKSKARHGENSRERVTFADVAGADEEKAELEEVVEYLKNPSKFTGLGAKIPHGVLLVGPPGTGKTLLAKAVAGEAGVPFFSMSGSDFVEMYVGVGASRVRDLFSNARKSHAAIIFIDEIDAVGRQRGAGLGGGHDEREQTLNQLLVEMDGFDGHSGIIVMAATNRPDILDSALLRPGRFDRQITIGLPDIKGREEILKVHAKGKPFEETVDMHKVAQTTVGFTGADLANLLNEAALLAARRSKSLIGMDEIEDAWVKVCVGTQKKIRMTEKEKRNTAIHEAGHAIIAHILPTQDNVRQISIIPSGRALGYTLTPPSEDKYSESKQEMKERIAMMLGGRVAEQIIFGDYTGGASNDIQRATEVARKMVTVYGMSDELGTIRYGSQQSEVFLGRDFGSTPDYSDATAAKIDAEIKKIVDESYNLAMNILTENKDKLDFIADFLMKHEIMDDEQFACAMKDGVTMEEVEALVTEKKRRSEEENKRRAEKAEAERRAAIQAQIEERKRMERELGLSDDNDEDGTQQNEAVENELPALEEAESQSEGESDENSSDDNEDAENTEDEPQE
ncbi:MAG: ATP-dependent zinc metalloprotease FtsH [Clostridia bacterium]|nr:ATP-dependent zinc metalloprotease FtsH [Clostridia bacterium]